MGPKHLIQKLLDKLMLCPLHFGTSSSQINSLSTFVLFSPLSLTLCQQEVVFCSSALWALPAVCVQMESKVSQQTKPPSSSALAVSQHQCEPQQPHQDFTLSQTHLWLGPLWACFLSYPEYKPSFWPLLLYPWNCLHSLKVISADV